MWRENYCTGVVITWRNNRYILRAECIGQISLLVFVEAVALDRPADRAPFVRKAYTGVCKTGLHVVHLHVV